MAGVPSVSLPEPLRLPHGSVRGGIAILVAATYGYLLLTPTVPTVPTVLVNSVVVVIAFYFGSRAIPHPTAAPGQPPAHPPRLVRAVLLLGFLGLLGWFLRATPSFADLPPALVQVLEVLAGYVGGMTASWLVHRRAHESAIRHRLATIFRDVSAAAALGITGYICYAFATGQGSVFAGRAEDALSLVVTYYFGSRVIGH